MSLLPSSNQVADLQRDLTDVVSVYPGEHVSYPFHVLKVNTLDTDIVIDMVVESAEGCKVGDVVTQVIMKDQLQYSVHGQIKSIDGTCIKLMYTSNGIAFLPGKAISGATEINILSCKSVILHALWAPRFSRQARSRFHLFHCSFRNRQSIRIVFRTHICGCR